MGKHVKLAVSWDEETGSLTTECDTKSNVIEIAACLSYLVADISGKIGSPPQIILMLVTDILIDNEKAAQAAGTAGRQKKNSQQHYE